jgi:hypothetical protein
MLRVIDQEQRIRKMGSLSFPGNALDRQVIDPRTACERLQRLPLGHPLRAEQELVELLQLIGQSPPDAATLFSLLEQTRGPLCFMREAAARHYLEKAPHLGSDEEPHFQRGIDVARLMMRSYTLCAGPGTLDDPARLREDPAQADYAATVLHRCLHYSGVLIFEHYRAKRELPKGIWARHNVLFATASHLGVATRPVHDQIFDEPRITHCQAAFVTPLLAEMSRPYGRNPRDLNLIWQWAEKTAHEVAIRPLVQPPPASGYAIELDQDAPLRLLRMIRSGRRTSLLETASLTDRLRDVLAELAKGASPEQLGLCEENIEHSSRLLGQLASLWSLETAQQRPPRTRQGSRVEVCTGFHAMHHFLLETEPEAAVAAQSKGQEGIPSRHAREDWEIVNRSPGGFCLATLGTGLKLANQQLLSLRPQGEPGFILGQVSWLRREQSGRLLAGIAVLPGRP